MFPKLHSGCFISKQTENWCLWNLGGWLCPQAALKILGGLQVNLPPCSQSVSQRRQQMQCNQYHYKVDRGFPKGSALSGEVGTILSQLVSLRVWSGKQDLQRIQKDFPRNDIFWDVQITGPARPDYCFLLYCRRISVSSACYLWFMALLKWQDDAERDCFHSFPAVFRFWG